MTKNAPFRFDIVGSFLRPQEIKEAREAFAKGKITDSELRRVEDREIEKLILKQKEAGLPVITDGEFRRSSWHLDFLWGLQGIERKELNHGFCFHGGESLQDSLHVVGKISGENHPFIEHFKYVKQFEDENVVARQTIPAPTMLLAELLGEENVENTRKIYVKEESLIQDIAAAYRQVIRDLYDAGCRNIQLDDCAWGMFCDKNYWYHRQQNDGATLEKGDYEKKSVNNNLL